MVDARLFSLSQMGANPQMNPQAVVCGEHWRIGILTGSLVRFEWSPSGVFVDDATPFALNRYFDPVPEIEVSRGADGTVTIDTGELLISYDGQAFSREGLSIYLKHVGSQESTWHYGDRQNANMGGTVRTLDQVNGATPLEPGLMSKHGWAIIDDSQANLIREANTVNGQPNPFGSWVFPKGQPSRDFYFFGYGGAITDAIADFYHLSGPTPLLPRFVFGNWWSRYHAYSQEEYQGLMERFEREGIPFTTAVIDTDWHLENIDPKYGSDWTGYSWNRELFPNPKAFLAWLHEHGFTTTVSLHPRDGIRAFEDQYPSVAQAMGVDPASEQRIDFDLTDPHFMSVYFDKVLHPMEDNGVDFWWIDWQQGATTKQPGLDPLWMLNHLHYLDSARRTDKRPITFSRYAGPGSHRYPIGFSGDTVVSWESLKFQPYFTSMASNIGYGWWSHDIGGHMFGYRDEQLEARWYQLGTFSPINRLHSTSSPFNGKEPWNFHPETRRAMTEALRLRHRLIPYLYSMNRRAAYENLPLVEPMYWNFSGGNVPTQYQFGSELIVSPVVQANDPALQKGKAQVWFPQGSWFDFFDGRRYEATAPAGRQMNVWRALDRIPVFAKAGGIVPLQQLSGAKKDSGQRLCNSINNPVDMSVLVFPGANGSFVLWEDDGKQQGQEHWAKTELKLDWGEEQVFTISCAQDGGLGKDGLTAAQEWTSVRKYIVPERRNWQIVMRGIEELSPSDFDLTVDDKPIDFSSSYDPEKLSLTINVSQVPTDAELKLVFKSLALASNPVREDAFSLLKDAQMMYFTKEQALAMVEQEGSRAVAALHTLEMPPGDYGEPQWFESHMPQPVIEGLTEILLRSWSPAFLDAAGLQGSSVRCEYSKSDSEK